MKFIGRQRELESLEREYQKDSSFVVIYGRRRVGKTTLIKEFIKSKLAFYFLATEEVESQSIKRLSGVVSRVTRNPLLQRAAFSDWLDLFHIIAEFRPEEKKVLVIDEFPYLVKSNPAFPSILQNAWDEVLKDSNVMLILCGSLIGMMQKHALSYDSPLYGRRTAQIRLAPLSFPDVYAAQHLSFERAVEQYAITGGVPKYLEFFNDQEGLLEQVESAVLSKNGFLYEEPNFLLKDEVVSAVNYFSIIRVMADGNHKLGKNCGSSGDRNFRADAISFHAQRPWLCREGKRRLRRKIRRSPVKAFISSLITLCVSGSGMSIHIKGNWNWTIRRLFWMKSEKTSYRSLWPSPMKMSADPFLQTFAGKVPLTLFPRGSELTG